MLEIETEKTDANASLRYSSELWANLAADKIALVAEKDALTTEVDSLKVMPKYEKERAEEAEAHLSSRPTEANAIRKYKASDEFAEIVKMEAAKARVEVAGCDSVEVARLREMVAEAANEVTCLGDQMSKLKSKARRSKRKVKSLKAHLR